MHAPEPSSPRAMLLAGGELTVTPRVLERVRGAGLVVAADGGARHAAALGLTVDVWVGDFDSSDGLTLDATRQRHPVDKDQTDLELALHAAKARGATNALVFGAFGGRFDHALGIALMAARETARGFAIDLEGGAESGWVLAPRRPLELPLVAGQTFSAIALEGDAQGLSIGGARWDLERAALAFGSGRGISNVARGPVSLTLERGVVLVVAQWDETR